MNRLSIHPLGEYAQSGEFLNIVEDFLKLTLSRPDEVYQLGRLNHNAVLSFGNSEFETIYFTDVLYLISPVDYKREFDHASVCSMSALYKLSCRLGAPLAAFALHFFAEIRACICDDKRRKKVLGPTAATTASVAAVAAWATHQFGLTEPIAVGLATSVLTIIASATKGAFCKMSEEEAKQSLTERVPAPRK